MFDINQEFASYGWAMITIDALEAFLTVARLGNVTRAAEALHRSQPAISRRIALMEQNLAAPLFERVGGRVRLSEAGLAFLPHAERALAAVRDGRAAVAALLGGEAGAVSLAMVGTLADSHLAGLLRRYAEDNPGIDVRLRTANSREVSNLVRTGEATLGLRYYPDDSPELVCRVVAHEPLHIVAAPGHALAGGRPVSVEDLRGQTWLGFPAEQGTPESAGPMLRRTLAAAGLIDVEVTVVDSLTAQKRLAEAGFGLAMLPVSSIREELSRVSLVRIDVESLRAANPIAAVYRRDGFLSPAAGSLLAMIEDTLPGETGSSPEAMTFR